MIRYKTDIDHMIKKQIGDFSLHSVHSNNDFKNLLLLVISEVNESSNLPLELKKEFHQKFTQEKINDIAQDMFHFYDLEKGKSSPVSFFKKFKSKLILVFVFQFSFLISYIFKLFGKESVPWWGHFIYLATIGFCGFVSYGMFSQYHSYLKQLFENQDQVFRNKIFVKLDEKIKDIYNLKV